MDDLRKGLQDVIAILRNAPHERVRVVRMADEDLQRVASLLHLYVLDLEEAAQRRIRGPCVTCIHRQRFEAEARARATDEEEVA